jgi:hypothetical protein
LHIKKITDNLKEKQLAKNQARREAHTSNRSHIFSSGVGEKALLMYRNCPHQKTKHHQITSKEVPIHVPRNETGEQSM